MTWKNFFGSAIGRKFTMGATGFLLITFLIVHCAINAMIFFNDDGQTFNHWAKFMGTNLIIRTMEIGLFVFLLLHIIQGIVIVIKNRAARPVGYVLSRPNLNSKWYSRSMGLLGTLILLFLIVHLYHFWVPSRFGGMGSIKPLEETQLFAYQNEEAHNLYQRMKMVFQGNLAPVIIYVLGVISLFWHLMHGFQSAFQTFGINHKKYTPIIKSIGVGYSVIICVLFALMPVAIYLEWVK